MHASLPPCVSRGEFSGWTISATRTWGLTLLVFRSCFGGEPGHHRSPTAGLAGPPLPPEPTRWASLLSLDAGHTQGLLSPWLGGAQPHRVGRGGVGGAMTLARELTPNKTGRGLGLWGKGGPAEPARPPASPWTGWGRSLHTVMPPVGAPLTGRHKGAPCHLLRPHLCRHEGEPMTWRAGLWPPRPFLRQLSSTQYAACFSKIYFYGQQRQRATEGKIAL